MHAQHNSGGATECLHTQATLAKVEVVEDRCQIKGALRGFLAVLHPDKNGAAGSTALSSQEWQGLCTQVSAHLNGVYSRYK